MDVVIAGGHGQIARRLGKLLVADGHRARGIVRNPDHVADLRADGIEAVLCDLESASDADVDAAAAGADAVVFAAGAGPGSGAARKQTVDHDAANRLLAAAQRNDIDRYVMVSAMGTDHPPQDDQVFSVYLRAKAAADADLRAAGVAHTIVRPGGLTDEPGTGRVHLARHVDRGQVTRDDVAAVLAAVLADPGTAGRTVELVGGATPIAEAVASIRDLPPD